VRRGHQALAMFRLALHPVTVDSVKNLKQDAIRF
jgi:hypothetical protein